MTEPSKAVQPSVSKATTAVAPLVKCSTVPPPTYVDGALAMLGREGMAPSISAAMDSAVARGAPQIASVVFPGVKHCSTRLYVSSTRCAVTNPTTHIVGEWSE
jgi:hypothetical protein